MTTQWHYADRRNQQQGPVDANWLQAAYARGEVDAATLVWREGLAAWQPLARLAGEIGIAIPAAAPARTPAPSMPGARGPVVVVAPREGTSGWVIGALVGGLVLLVMIGILAAIAIPAYQDYTLRAKVAEGLNAAAPLKLAVAESWYSEERCPTHDDQGMQPPERYANRAVRSVTLGDEGAGACTITLRFIDLPRPGEEGVLMLVRDGDDWRYRTTLPDRLLPSSIRGRTVPLD